MRGWLSGRRRQTVNLLVKPTLVRIQLLSLLIKLKRKLISKFTRKNKYRFFNTQTIQPVNFKKPINPSIYLNYSVFRSFITENRLSVLGLVMQDLENTDIVKLVSFFYKNCNKFFYKTFNFNYVYVFRLRPVPYLTMFDFFANNNSFGFTFFKRILLLNFRRFRFFPNIQNYNGNSFVNLSLGMFSKFFKKGKSFIKNKLNFLVIAGFLRKMLIFINLHNLILIVKHVPMYLQEILSTINNPVIVNYQNPFTGSQVDEIFLQKRFYFFMFIFSLSKSYSFLKQKKKGRVKRKITKRIVKVNRLVD